MRVMYIATGKHYVADNGEEIEFDNSESSNVPTFKNTRILSDNCGNFLVTKYPACFKQVADIEAPKPVKFPEAGSNFVRLRPTNAPVAPVTTVAETVAPVEPPASKIYRKK